MPNARARTRLSLSRRWQQPAGLGSRRPVSSRYRVIVSDTYVHNPQGITIHFGTMDIVAGWRVTDSAAAFVWMRLSELRSRRAREFIEGYGFQDRFNVDLTNTSRATLAENFCDFRWLSVHVTHARARVIVLLITYNIVISVKIVREKIIII